MFRNWLVHEVIPSLMKTGTYTVPDVALQQRLQMIEVQNRELQLRLEQETMIKSNPINYNQARNMLPMEELYIMSTLQYEPHYIYKIGRSGNTPQRLVSLNTSHLKKDQLFVCYRAQCIDSINAESHAHRLLEHYRKENNREFFVMEFHVLRRLIDIVCQSFRNTYDEWIEILENARNQPLPSINPHRSFPVLSTDAKRPNGSITTYFLRN